MTMQNPFDFNDLIKRLDPAALTEQYKELLGKFSLPNLDTKALMVRKTQDETTKLVTNRFNESLAELRASIAKLTPEAT
jgi:hypothetical protein